MHAARRCTWLAVAAGLLVLVSAAALAQGTMIEIKNGKVLAVDGNRLVVRTAEGVQEYDVPDGFHFDMDGKSLGVQDLKPGMMLTAMITTTERPQKMTTTEVTEAEVVHRVGSTVVVRTSDGKIQRFSSKDVKSRGVIMQDSHGMPIDMTNLKPGDKVTATVITEQPPQTITERELQVLVQEAPPPPKPAVAQARPQPAPAPPKPMPVSLPKTATPLPLVGLGGALLLALGAGATLVRRFRG